MAHRPTDFPALTFCGVKVDPDFGELRQAARELAEATCEAFDLPAWDRERFVSEFEEKRVLETVDWLTELYGERESTCREK